MAGRRPQLRFRRPAQTSLALRAAGSLVHLTVGFIKRLRLTQLPDQAARRLPYPRNDGSGCLAMHTDVELEQDLTLADSGADQDAQIVPLPDAW